LRQEEAMKKALIVYDRVVEEGSDPDQRDALIQAGAVARELRKSGMEPREFSFSLDVAAFMKSIRAEAPEFVFNLVESVEGHGRLIHFAPALLDVLGIPYTGSKADSLYVTSNKRLAKRWLEAAGIPTPVSFSEADLGKSRFMLRGRYIVKSVWEHASIGLGEDSVVTPENSHILLKELERRRDSLRGEGFAEEYIEGREFNLSLLASVDGPEVLPPAEMRFEKYPPGKLKMVDYRAKWDEDSFESRHTERCFSFSPSEGPLLQQLKDLAKRCWHLFDLRGYARVDFRVDEAGLPWVLEINANPCISPDAGFIAAAGEAGLTYRQVMARILRDSGIEL
jgi:D-alanine-D-alanine ligase